MRDHYEDSLSMRDAITVYFAANHFGPDGGYSDPWVKLKLGPITFYMPNTKSRVAAVRIHDLHHVATGYQTNWSGEFEISAWELAVGCGRFPAAWWLNLGGLMAGMLTYPRRTLAAYRLGRRCQGLYGEEYGPALLSQTVTTLRERMGITAAEAGRATADTGLGKRLGDALLFLAYLALALPVATVSLLASIFVFVPIALLQSRRPPTAGSGSASSLPTQPARSSPAM